MCVCVCVQHGHSNTDYCWSQPKWKRPISQIPQCTGHISHNAPFITETCTSHNALVTYPKMHRPHFETEMCTHVHISVTKWCIVGYVTSALWNLCNRSIAEPVIEFGDRFNIKTIFPGIWIPFLKDKIGLERLSYLYNGNSYTDKMESLYWNSPRSSVSIY